MQSRTLPAIAILMVLCHRGAYAGTAAAAEYPIAGIVARCGTPPAPWQGNGDGNIHADVTEWARPQGLQAAYWRGLVVAEPRRADTTWERIRQGVKEPFRHNLTRPWDDSREEAPEGYDTLLRAIRCLYQGQTTGDAKGVLAHAACWMAAPELAVILQPLSACEKGELVCSSLPRASFEHRLPPWERDRDVCQAHLSVSCPSNGIPTLPLLFHGVEHNWAEQWLRERKGTIPLAEYRRRVLCAAAEEQDPFLTSQPGWRKPVSLCASADAATLLVQVAEAAGLHLRAAATGAPGVHVRVSQARAGDVARAIARLVGWVILPDGEGAYLAVPAAGPREEFLAALPLSVWAALSMTGVETAVFSSDAVACVWRAAPAEGLASAEGTKEVALQPRGRTALEWVVNLYVGEHLRPWLLSLPDRELQVPLALYESDAYGFFELAAPTVSEVVQGARYIALKGEWDGRNCVVRKAMAAEVKGD